MVLRRVKWTTRRQDDPVSGGQFIAYRIFTLSLLVPFFYMADPRSSIPLLLLFVFCGCFFWGVCVCLRVCVAGRGGGGGYSVFSFIFVKGIPRSNHIYLRFGGQAVTFHKGRWAAIEWTLSSFN